MNFSLDGLSTAGGRLPALFLAGLVLGLVFCCLPAPAWASASISTPTAPVSAPAAPAAVATTTDPEPLPATDSRRIIDEIRHRYRRVKLYQGSFTQRTTYVDSNETSLSTGLIWLQGPDKMRWEYQLPEPQLLTADGETLWYHTPSLKQVMVGKVKDIKEARIIVNLLSEIGETGAGYQVKVSREADLIAVSLRPVAGEQSPPFEEFRLLFTEKELRLKESRMVDLFGNRIVINYKWQESPAAAPLPKAHFVFVPPAGCDIMPLN
ncbi:MAG: outer membrane lipoprotein carrier protein LolA [Deltaproteobacteria bacterium]|nr:outer membrane lipoprotein carrier protein LolA [Deltaproteobacteria bacterium]